MNKTESPFNAAMRENAKLQALNAELLKSLALAEEKIRDLEAQIEDDGYAKFENPD